MINAPIISPCVLTCELDLHFGQCKGCGRSREQIAKWTRYSHEERVQIMETLPAELEKVLAPQKGLGAQKH